MSGGFYQFQAPQLRVIPFKQPARDTEAKVEDLVQRIAKEKEIDPRADTTALEVEIDRHVYDLYGLTKEDIAIVEDS